MRGAAILVVAVCGLFAAPVSALPIEREGFRKLLIDLSWSVGDRGTTIELQYGLDDESSSYLKVSEITSGNFLITQGRVALSAAEVEKLLAMEKVANFFSVPSDRAPPRDANGVEHFLICYSHLSIHERNSAAENWSADRDCPDEKSEPALVHYAKDLIRVARNHFPDLGVPFVWAEVLK